MGLQLMKERTRFPAGCGSGKILAIVVITTAADGKDLDGIHSMRVMLDLFSVQTLVRVQSIWTVIKCVGRESFMLWSALLLYQSKCAV